MKRPVITRFFAGILRFLLLAALVAVPARPVWAVSYSFTTKSDMDTLSVGFPPQAGYPTVTRTGAREISLIFPPGTEGLAVPPESLDFKQSRFIEGVRPIPGGLAVVLRSDAVGFVGWPAGEGGLKLQIYRDPQGAKWTPPGPPQGQNIPESPGPPPQAVPAAGPGPAPKGMPPGEKRPVDLPPLAPPAPSVQEGAPDAGRVADQVSPPAGDAETPPVPPSGPAAPPVAADAAREPFFSVPHSLRAGVERAGPTEATVLRPGGAISPPVPPSPSASPDAPSGTFPPATGRQAVPPPAAADDLIAPPPAAPSGETPVRSSGLPPLPPGLESREGELKARVTPPAPPIAAAPVSPVFSGPQAVRSQVSRETPPAVPPGDDAMAIAPGVPASPADPAAPVPDAGQSASAEPPASSEPGQPDAEPADTEEPLSEQAQIEAENDGMLMAAQAKRLAGEHAAALEMLNGLKERTTLTPGQREETLYALAETIYDISKTDPLAHFDAIQGAFQEALNFNAKSSRIPGALLVLGMLNLRAGNIPEATAYFNILRKRYPNDENIPLIHFYWGEHYFEKDDYQKAAKEYQELIQRYPESRFVREASMGMAKALVRLGQYKEAWQIADYIEKRWPRYYIEFPPILRINGEIAYRLDDFKKSKDYYLTSYNIDPNAEGSDLVLARLGDIATHLERAREATEFYELAVARFPDKEGGLISKMRLAEHGVYDDPSIGDMFSAFDKPIQGGPEAIYAQIVRDHPKSPLAPLAQIKLAMWQLYKDRYLQALESATTFEKMFPDNPLAQRAGEVAATAFERMVEPMLRNQQYAQIAELWREHPLLEKHRSIISDKGQLAAALSLLRTGNPGESLRLALPFVQPAQTEPGVNALLLALHIYQEGSAWREILSLVDRVRDWKFTMDQRQRLEFAAAQALEHLGDTARSRPLWTRLAADFSLPSPRRAIAMYYQAKEAKAKNDAEKTLVFAQEAMNLLRENDLDPDKVADCLNMLVDAAKSLGQYPQALDYAEQYGKTLPENGPDFAANRFRMAAIYREMGETAKWRATLEQMRDTMPGTLYGRMAASELSARALEDRADALTRSN